MMRYELADHEWVAIRPTLPNKLRGVARVNDRRVLGAAFWVLRSGAPWRDLPDHFGPYTTCHVPEERRATTGSPPAISPSCNSRQPGYGCVFMSPHPSKRSGADLTFASLWTARAILSRGPLRLSAA